jgi:hypothetical protein
MHIPAPVIRAMWQRLEPITHRIPDEIIGHKHRWRATHNGAPVERPFLLRWFVGGEKHAWGGNSYLHQFIRDDEDRALHDHPWWNLSILLGGQYIEHTIKPGGVHWRQLYKAGDAKLRSPQAAHRVELTYGTASGNHMNGLPEVAPHLPAWVRYSDKSPSWSLFITGPKQRPWGFHCPEAGWRSNREFSDKGGCA